MGSISRGNRCERFIAEFADDVVKHFDLPQGVIHKAWLDSHDVFEMVFLYIELKFPSGEYIFMDPNVIFDPECPDDDDLIESVKQYCHDDADKARQRLEKADLL
jgi:predicted metal-dependent hydrolase